MDREIILDELQRILDATGEILQRDINARTETNLPDTGKIIAACANILRQM